MSVATKEEQKPESSGSGSFPGYTVEAKVENFIPHRPVVIENRYDKQMVLDGEWRGISFPTAVVNHIGHYKPRYEEHFVYPYATAMALAWMLVAQNPSTSILARIVPYKIHYTHETWRDGEPEIVGFGKWYDKQLAEVGERLEESERKKKKKAK